jgi:DNA polymerase phi
LNPKEENNLSIDKSESFKKDLQYTLKRLVNGLSSSRESARLGFACCLVEIIKLECVNIDAVIDLIEDANKITGSTKRSEERDLLFGKLFGYLSIIRSDRLKNDDIHGIIIIHMNHIIEEFIYLFIYLFYFSFLI